MQKLTAFPRRDAMAWMVPMMSDGSDVNREEESRLLAALVQQDTAARFEFKILRGGPVAFRGRERLQRVLEEESRAQWELVTKLDDSRIVLRRPRDARARDMLRGDPIDPYRTELRATRSAGLIVVALAVSTALVLGLMLQRGPDVEIAAWPMVAVLLVLLLITLIAMVLVVATRRR
jgi:hypothetical protein